MNMETAKALQVWFSARARINSGDSPEVAVVGAIRECGPLRAVRVSSAQVRGRAKKYSYWGAVRYAIGLSADGKRLQCMALERASSDRRSLRLAEDDAYELSFREGRVFTSHIGGILPDSVARLLELLP